MLPAESGELTCRVEAYYFTGVQLILPEGLRNPTGETRIPFSVLVSASTLHAERPPLCLFPTQVHQIL